MKPIVCLYTLGGIFAANMDNTNNHPLICDPIEGACGLPQEQIQALYDIALTNKPIKVIYFTDPICSSCWGIEPQLRKLKLEYGHYLEIEYRMGGLLPDWSYNSGGISKPADVAHHWDEVSLYYDMPIDGDVWLEDPLDSSYPPSIAFKAAQAQDNNKAILFLRAIREMVFLQKKNITRWECLQEAAISVGLDTAKLKTDYHGHAKVWFEEDLAIARQYGVRGFPTIFFTNEKAEQQMVYGTKGYEFYENAVRALVPDAEKHSYPADWESLFKKYTSLTAKEFSFLAKLDRRDGEQQLRALSDKGFLIKVDTKNGSVWFGR